MHFKQWWIRGWTQSRTMNTGFLSLAWKSSAPFSSLCLWWRIVIAKSTKCIIVLWWWGWDVNGFLSKSFHFYWYLSVIHPLVIATAYPALGFIEGPDLFPHTVGGGGEGGRVHLRSCQRIAGLTPTSIRSWKQCQVANTSGSRAFVHRWKEAGISGGKPQGQNTNVTQKGFALGHKPKTLSLWGGTSSFCTRPVIIPH